MLAGVSSPLVLLPFAPVLSCDQVVTGQSSVNARLHSVHSHPRAASHLRHRQHLTIHAKLAGDRTHPPRRSRRIWIKRPPCPPLGDPIDRAHRDAVVFRDILPRDASSLKISNFSDLLLRQLAGGCSFSPRLTAPLDHVVGVLLRRALRQVLNADARRIIAGVTHLSFWPNALGDEPRDAVGESSLPVPDTDDAVPRLIFCGGPDDAVSLDLEVLKKAVGEGNSGAGHQESPFV